MRRALARRPTLVVPVFAVVACAGHDPPPAPRGGLRPVLVAASPADADLTAVNGLDVDSRGNVYVADQGGRVLVLDPNGRLVRTVGRKGSGPGELDAADALRILPGDSLYVFDAGLQRGTVWPPGSASPAYTVSVAAGGRLFPYWAMPVPRGGGLIAAYRAAYGDGDGRGAEGRRLEILRLLGADGSLRRDSVMAFREMELLALHGEVEGVAFNSFARQTLFALGPGDRVYSVWTGAVEVDVRTAAGQRVRTIRPRLSVGPRPVTARERDSVIRELSGDHVPAAAVRRALDRARTETWPLVTGLVVDDAGHPWLGIPSAAGPVRWTAFDDAGEVRAWLDLPARVVLRAVRGGRAYAVERDDDDVPRVVIYALHPLSPEPAR